MILFFDTETTGLPDWRAPSDAEHQPHLVQFAAVLTESDGITEAAAIDLIIRPDGWTIPEEASDIHGISTLRAVCCGVGEELVVDLFLDLAKRASTIVAHNVSFDMKLMRIGCARYGRPKDIETQTFCTMQAATPIVNLPPTPKMLAAGFNKPKSPKLVECMQHFFGEDLDGAHNALVDVRACARVYHHLKNLEQAA